MGLFDEIIFNYPLSPEDEAYVKKGTIFQTKDLENSLDVYILTEDGRLTNEDGKDLNYHGDLNIYTSNIVGGSPNPDGGYDRYTENGEDAKSFDYVIRFTEGKLSRFISKTARTEPAKSMSQFPISDSDITS